MIDWDTLRLAPKERDLVNAFDAGSTDLPDSDAFRTYQRAVGQVTLHEESVELFRLWWGLAEICTYTSHFRNPLGDGQDDRLSWQALLHYASDVP